ncbi:MULTISPECIES: hypothetical protein [unclassified Curtobacterium]|uniref:hypothetical protein n=1 Tax=unclassified Curtobacterium TaxID=257496 RepID=UPI00226B0021|nr:MULTISPECIES: hypothetical protein [unclassified Curtobacterium]
MTRRHPSTVLTASIVIAIGTTALLTACSGSDAPEPTRSATATRTASPTPTPTRTPTPTTAPSASTTTAPAPAPAPSDDPSGSDDDGAGQGTGNGSGADAPDTVDYAAVTQQGVAAAGGGTVVSLTGSGDNWTVVVAGPDGSLTQSVVSATLGRVTSGPFPKDSDAATKTANAARAAGLKVDAAAAAKAATSAVSGTLTSLQLGGTRAAPTWTASVTVSGAARSVTVNGLTGAATAS